MSSPARCGRTPRSPWPRRACSPRSFALWLLSLVVAVGAIGASAVHAGPLSASPSPLTLAASDFAAINDGAAGARPEPDCTPQAAGVRYDVGSAAYPTLNQVPWDQLRPDDVVCVPYRMQPYRNKIYFITRGAPGHPIRLVGLRGPNGERPVIDGDQATTPPMIKPSAADAYLQDLGLIALHNHFLKPAGAPWGWHPGHITITGFKVQHARGQYQYFDAAGNARNYAHFTAGIFINPGDEVVVEDCEITDNALGIFANSHEGVFGPAELTTQNLTLRGNYVHGNGDATTLSIHNVYIEGHGCNVIGNYFGHEAGKVGTNYKSRCSHERFYANHVNGGYQGLLMLVDPQSGWDALGTAADFEPTVVAGNVLVNPYGAGTSSGGMVHFGGDSYTQPAHYRRTLLMLHNTIVDHSHDSRVSVLMPVDSTATGLLMDQWLANNAIVNLWDQQGSGAAELGLAANDGNALLTTNWIGSDVVHKGQYNVMKGQVTGWAGSLRGASPQWLGAALADLRPAPGSPLIDAATAYPALPVGSKAAQVNDFALYEFLGTPSAPWYRKRAVQGGVADIGAYEAPSPGSNQAPAAAANTYGTPANTPLHTTASGVLANDSDPDGDPIAAALVAGPAHGSLTLNSNGSFSYTPAAGYTGPDSFSYTATDGALASAPVTVTINVGVAQGGAAATVPTLADWGVVLLAGLMVGAGWLQVRRRGSA